MNIREKLKQFVKDNGPEIVLQTSVVVVTIAVYTTVCASKGYRMNRPFRSDDDKFYVQTISRKILSSPILPK